MFNVFFAICCLSLVFFGQAFFVTPKNRALVNIVDTRVSTMVLSMAKNGAAAPKKKKETPKNDPVSELPHHFLLQSKI